MAILTHPKYGDEAWKFHTNETKFTKANITPMKLLVKHMTGNSQLAMHPSVMLLYNAIMAVKKIK